MLKRALIAVITNAVFVAGCLVEGRTLVNWPLPGSRTLGRGCLLESTNIGAKCHLGSRTLGAARAPPPPTATRGWATVLSGNE